MTLLVLQVSVARTLKVLLTVVVPVLMCLQVKQCYFGMEKYLVLM